MAHGRPSRTSAQWAHPACGDEFGPTGQLPLNDPRVTACYRELSQIVDSHQTAPDPRTIPQGENEFVSRDGRRWAIQPGDEPDKPGNCRSCDGPILWVKRLNKASQQMKAHPLDADGRSHFATCPQREQWRPSS